MSNYKVRTDLNFTQVEICKCLHSAARKSSNKSKLDSNSLRSHQFMHETNFVVVCFLFFLHVAQPNQSTHAKHLSSKTLPCAAFQGML